MIGGSTRLLAILGDPVAHSLSPAMHNAAFRALGLDAVYVPLQVAASDVASVIGVLARAGGAGNVTVPHKEAAARAITRPSERVRAVGVCNTFWSSDGQIAGDNTDVHGVRAALTELEAPANGWLVAGTGGGARAVVAAAKEMGARVAVRSRDPSRRAAFERWASGLGVGFAKPEECEVIINATPLGLHAGDHLPLALDNAPDARVAFDLIYARGETAWVRTMRRNGLRAGDGRTMLVAQGAEAFRHWFPEEDPPVEIMRSVVNDALR